MNNNEIAKQEITRAKMLINHIMQLCARNEAPNDFVKNEFKRLRKLGVIIYYKDTGAMIINERFNKQ